VSTVPYAVQQKVLRVMRATAHQGASSLLQRDDGGSAADETAEATIARVEQLRGYTTAGDLVSHLDTEWRFGSSKGITLSELTIDTVFIPLIRQFSRSVREAGATPIVSFTSVKETFYSRNRAPLDSIHHVLSVAPELTVPSPPSQYAFPDSLFFDTIYHLNRAGRDMRSARLADDILRSTGGQPACPSTSPSTHKMP
jgi:hypothetical protein